MLNVVIIHTIRGGRDPDEYLHVVTDTLAAKLDPVDPWSRLGGLEDARDPGILRSYLPSKEEALKWASDHGCNVIKTIDAVGY